MKYILALLVLVVAAPVGVSGGVLYPAALTLEPGYASGPPPGFPWWAVPAYGAPLAIFGRVAAVGAPLTDLVPAGAYELTYAYEGATCVSTGNWDGPCSGGIDGMFQNGAVAFFLDTTPDADFANPATFRDGEVVLVALLSYTYVADDDPYAACPPVPDVPDLRAGFTFAGGSWFARVASHGTGLQGMSEGELDGNVPPDLQALGYIFRVDGRVDVFGPVAVTPTTWGAVKALYR